MPRPPRLHVPGGFYHATARGNHRRNIFFRPADRWLLDRIVADALDRTGVRIHAYCWMPNHVHLLIQVADQPLADFMQRIASRYARTVQKRVPTTGHLFENRYHAMLVDVDSYFQELLRYIHLNPVRAGIVATPDRYSWSSHRRYLGGLKPDWVNPDFGLSLFGHTTTEAREHYARFVAERIGAGRDPSLYEGHPQEPRVLGTDRFLSELALPAVQPIKGLTLCQIVDAISAEAGVTLAELRSPRQDRRLSRARGLITAQALRHQAATLSDIARLLNRERSTLTRAAQRYSP